MTWHGAPARPPELAPVWRALEARARSELGATYEALENDAQVYRAGERAWQGGQDRQWWRLAIVPITRAWPIEDRASREAIVPFGARAEVHLPADTLDPLPMLEAVQIGTFMALHGWLPDEEALTTSGGRRQATVRHPVVRSVQPHPVPLWDEERDLWYTTAEYVVTVETPDIGG